MRSVSVQPRIVVPFGLVAALLWALASACTTDSGSREVEGQAARPVSPAPGADSLSAASARQGAAPPAKPPQPASSLPQLEAGTWHPVYRLVPNRLLAHVVRADNLAIPAGHPGVAKYLSFGKPWRPWALNRTLDGRKVALATRSESWLAFPLTAAQAGAATALWARINSPRPQGLRLRVNGRRAGRLRLQPGWQRVELELPAGALRAGENRITFRWARSGPLGGKRKVFGALEWLRLGAAAPAEEARVELARGGRLLLPRDGGVAYYIQPVAGARLQLSFEARPASARCSVRVSLQPEGGTATVKTLTETGLSQGRTRTFVPLDVVAGKVTRLELTARGETCAGLALEGAIVMPGPAPRVERGKKPRNVVFWLIDNLRADRVKLYNPDTRVETPVLTRLGKEGTVFERAYIAGTESRVSHASIWTGMFPRQHRFIGPKNILKSSWVTLAEPLRKHGMYTACWVANGNISKFWGFAEGFRYFRNTLHKGGGMKAADLADHGIRLIQQRGDQPFYLYLGTIDCHVSWRGKQPWLAKYHPEPYRGRFRRNVMGPVWDKIAANPGAVPPADRKRALAIYDSTISYNDHHLGRLLAALEAEGIRDQTMIVVTADHGEELWEYGRIGHGGSCKNEVLDVPLIVHYPPLFGKGVRVEEGVDVISVMATILDAVGAPIPGTVQAASLLPLAQGVGAGYPRVRYGTQYEIAFTVRQLDHKLWVGSKGVPRLYDMTRPRRPESKNVAAERPLATRMLTDALSTFRTYQSRWRQSRWGVMNNHLPAMADDLEQGKGPERIRP